MSKATFVPAVTETKTVEVSPAKVTLELTVIEALHVATLVGGCNSRNISGAFVAPELDNYALFVALQNAVNRAGFEVPKAYEVLSGGSIRYLPGALRLDRC